MAFTFGFYNSKDGDRTYDAEQFSGFLDGIVYDGVYQSVGMCFEVKVSSGMKITVDSGRAWFDHTWTLNTSKLTLTVSNADTVYNRYDAVVLEVNKTDRKNYLKIIKGKASAAPLKPELTKTTLVIQHAIAYILVKKNSSSIAQSNIEYVVGTAETPYVSAISLAGIPSGGNVGYVLAKSSNESGAVNWYHPDHLPYDNWIYVSGITSSDVLAAWKFIGAETEAAALNSINEGTKYLLEKTGSNVQWSAADGIYIPKRAPSTGTHYANGLKNTVLGTKEIGTVVVKYAKMEPGNTVAHMFYKNGVLLSAKVNYYYTGYYDETGGNNEADIYTKRPGIIFNPNFIIDTHEENVPIYVSYSIPEEQTNGVISGNMKGDDPILFFNGEKCALTRDAFNISAQDSSGVGYLSVLQEAGTDIFIGNSFDDTNNHASSYYIHAVIIFNRVLTDTETARVHEAMMAL